MENNFRRRRTTQRQPLSCTECARRKMRCSKIIPCKACIDRGKEHECRRENVQIRNRASASCRGLARNPRDRSLTAQDVPNASQGHPSTPQTIQQEELDSTRATGQCTTIRSQEARDSSLVSSGARRASMAGVCQDTAVVLESLALGRHHVTLLCSGLSPTGSNATSAPTLLSADPVVSASQAESLFLYHQENIAWMYHAVHLPTFRKQCNQFHSTGQPADAFWLSLYYAMLSATIYHTSPEILAGWAIDVSQVQYGALYDKSLESLFTSKFMSIHSIYSLQAICMLVHVGHNRGESDLMTTLMGSAIRIAQSLNLHRLGHSEPQFIDSVAEPDAIIDILIEREVGKRVWWFLVRQDWLQIEFHNTYTIHACHFNTPMPANCHDDREEFAHGTAVLVHDVDTYTQGSYTAVLNHVALLIWKTQNRMYSVGHPDRIAGGLEQLYNEVLIADAEMRKIMRQMPIFYREESVFLEGLPPHVGHQKRITLSSMAHKFFTIHRHFQFFSLKNSSFAFTKLSCLPIARKGLLAILSMPPGEFHWIARSMWTLNASAVTLIITLLFEELFASNEENNLFDGEEIRNIAEQCLVFFREISERSEIASKGVRIIELLLDTNREFNLEEMIIYVMTASKSDGQLGFENFIMDGLSLSREMWEGILESL